MLYFFGLSIPYTTTTSAIGMPECKFGLNDKLIMEKEGGASAAAVQSKTAGTAIRIYIYVHTII